VTVVGLNSSPCCALSRHLPSQFQNSNVAERRSTRPGRSVPCSEFPDLAMSNRSGQSSQLIGQLKSRTNLSERSWRRSSTPIWLGTMPSNKPSPNHANAGTDRGSVEPSPNVRNIVLAHSVHSYRLLSPGNNHKNDPIRSAAMNNRVGTPLGTARRL
jgi:hypothetical protein